MKTKIQVVFQVLAIRKLVTGGQGSEYVASMFTDKAVADAYAAQLRAEPTIVAVRILRTVRAEPTTGPTAVRFTWK